MEQKLQKEDIESAFSLVLDNSLSTAGVTLAGLLQQYRSNRIELTMEYKHLDEMTKLMILKLRDIHQQLTTEGKEWFGKREEICLCFVFL